MASNFNLGIVIDSPEKSSLDFIDQFINDQKSKSTTNKEKYDLKNFSSFCKTNFNEVRSIESIPAEELDNLLCHFFIKAKTKQGKLYEPDTLNCIRNSLQRVLIEKGSKMNIRDDMEFCRSRKVLTARRKQLTKLGKGNKPNATRALTEKEVDLLYSSKYFGSSTPVSLQRTIWWIITTNFGHRARNEARQLLFGDIKIKVSEGTEYLEWDTESKGQQKREMVLSLWDTNEHLIPPHLPPEQKDALSHFTTILFLTVLVICAKMHLHCSSQ